MASELLSGYLDVKISSKSRRGFTPWKAWQKQWCEIKRLDSIENGLELKLKSGKEGSVLNCITLPRSSTICRTDSRTKRYAFGVFNLGRNKKPLIFLSGNSESNSQQWMSSIRRILSIASYIPVGNANFRVSLVDNEHSRSAGLVGLFGVLSITQQELVISDPCTGEQKLSWKWFQFHQFHHQAATQPIDEKKIIVMHTSGEFSVGPGQLYLYCNDGSTLLHYLVARGQLTNTGSCYVNKRLSRSEGDIYCAANGAQSCDMPSCFHSQSGSEDSGIRASIVSDEFEYVMKCANTESMNSIGIALITNTPGSSEADDSSQDLRIMNERTCTGLPRNESGISLCSGIYEEIPDDLEAKQVTPQPIAHVYENPVDLILESKNKQFAPPPLPPRLWEFCHKSGSYRCSTLPAKDLSKLSRLFMTESDYEIMSPSKTFRRLSVAESIYLPMSPGIPPS
ncbi:uncharacterized protein isoform X2 [Leptinotarsa decemlineata]|uniref:uncharacterized protein isoform X2 n=1 Tax=Leptinotarsa decemlineata TaxID=7539 RepID=UPI003D30964F